MPLTVAVYRPLCYSTSFLEGVGIWITLTFPNTIPMIIFISKWILLILWSLNSSMSSPFLHL